MSPVHDRTEVLGKIQMIASSQDAEEAAQVVVHRAPPGAFSLPRSCAPRAAIRGNELLPRGEYLKELRKKCLNYFKPGLGESSRTNRCPQSAAAVAV